MTQKLNIDEHTAIWCIEGQQVTAAPKKMSVQMLSKNSKSYKDGENCHLRILK